MKRRTFMQLVVAAALAGHVSGAFSAEPFYANSFEHEPSVAAMTAVGRVLFSDRSLSHSGQMSCATCHDPTRAYGPPESQTVSGIRAIPSLRYGQAVPPFTEHYFEAEGDDSVDQGPTGGRTWDGRAQSAHEQARMPLFSSQEMANTTEADVVTKIQQAPYAALFRTTFGAHVFDDVALAFKAVLLALEVFQQNPADFYPYSSKYDAWLRGEATLTAQERRGLELFNDPASGNCARCHPSSMKGGAFPQFTDYGYVALGVPRHAQIPANTDPQFFDLGLCGPLRTDLAGKAAYCGFFRTPTLRNVATRRVFFHNGVVGTLDDAVRFYAERDITPQRWYPSRAGAVIKFDDLPLRYQGNVENDAPFGRHAGDTPTLSGAQIDDLVAFLRTLTDSDVAVADTPG
jgi:cytochrome c peroxidase